MYLPSFHIRFEHNCHSVTGTSMAHEPSFEFAAEPNAGRWVRSNRLEKHINFTQPAVRSRNVTVGDINNVLNNTDEVPFEERMPDKVHQVF